MGKRRQPDYVLCQGPITASDGVYFLVEVFPQTLTGGRLIKFPVSGSSCPDPNKPHHLAWAVGYRVIDLVSQEESTHFGPSGEGPLEVAGIRAGRMFVSEEIYWALRDAAQKTRARLVVRCPECKQIRRVGKRDLTADEPVPYGDKQPLVVHCRCGRKIKCLGAELLVYVEPGESPLERALRGA